MRPVQFVDARDVEPLKLELAALAWLLEHRHLTLSQGSPLHFLAEDSAAATEQARAQAQQALRARGLLYGGSAVPAPGPALLQRALEVLARPQRRLSVEQRLGAAAPQPKQLWFLRGEQAARLVHRSAGLEVHAAQGRDLLATALSKLLQPSAAPALFVPVELTRLQLQAAAQVWGQHAGAPAPRAVALERLRAAGLPAADAKALLDECLGVGLAREHQGALALTPAALAALQPVWSGHRVELLLRDLPQEPLEDEEALQGREAALVAVGPPGSRLLVEAVPAVAREDTVRLSWLTREKLGEALTVLLQLEAH